MRNLFIPAMISGALICASSAYAAPIRSSSAAVSVGDGATYQQVRMKRMKKKMHSRRMMNSDGMQGGQMGGQGNMGGQNGMMGGQGGMQGGQGSMQRQ